MRCERGVKIRSRRQKKRNASFVLMETVRSTGPAGMGLSNYLHTTAAVNIESVNSSPPGQKFPKDKEALPTALSLSSESQRPNLLSHSPRQFSETSYSFLLLPFIFSSKYYFKLRQLLNHKFTEAEETSKGHSYSKYWFHDKADIRRNTVQEFLAEWLSCLFTTTSITLCGIAL